MWSRYPSMVSQQSPRHLRLGHRVAWSCEVPLCHEWRTGEMMNGPAWNIFGYDNITQIETFSQKGRLVEISLNSWNILGRLNFWTYHDEPIPWFWYRWQTSPPAKLVGWQWSQAVDDCLQVHRHHTHAICAKGDSLVPSAAWRMSPCWCLDGFSDFLGMFSCFWCSRYFFLLAVLYIKKLRAFLPHVCDGRAYPPKHLRKSLASLWEKKNIKSTSISQCLRAVLFLLAQHMWILWQFFIKLSIFFSFKESLRSTYHTQCVVSSCSGGRRFRDCWWSQNFSVRSRCRCFFRSRFCLDLGASTVNELQDPSVYFFILFSNGRWWWMAKVRDISANEVLHLLDGPVEEVLILWGKFLYWCVVTPPENVNTVFTY